MKTKNTNDKKNLKKIVHDVVEDLLELMGIKAKIDVIENESEASYAVNIDAPNEAGLLIGNRGKTMLDFQMIVGMVVKRKTDEWKRIIVNVGDWREKESKKLEVLANQAAERAKETGEPQFLYNLNPSQRRIIHLYLSEIKDVETRSEGEGEGRYLIVSSK